MPLRHDDDVLALAGVVTVDEAEPVASWLRAHPSGSVDLAECSHLHTAALQALLAARPRIAAPATAPFLATWVMPWLYDRTAPVIPEGAP